MKKKTKTILLVSVAAVLIAVLAVCPLLFVDGEFGGADNAGSDVISEIDPDFQPIAEQTITEKLLGRELPGETESMLFALQAALGAGIIGYGFGYFRSRKKFSQPDPAAEKQYVND